MKNLWNSNRLTLLCLALLLVYPTQHCFSQNFYKEFSWYNFQGKYFLTPPKDQQATGACHIFAAVAHVESLYELLYFDSNANLDLSEWHLLSQCTEFGDHDYIYPFLEDYGVIEECSGYEFPSGYGDNISQYYFDCEGSCCEDPGCDDKYKITYHEINIGTLPNDAAIQDSVYKYGPIQMWANSTKFAHTKNGAHALLLHGWKTIDEELWWLFKDSWQDSASYNYKILASSVNLTTLFDISAHKAKVITAVNKYEEDNGDWDEVEITRSCSQDNDGDGYCFWGVGTKPCSHGSHSEQDYDDNDANVGPLLDNGWPMPLTGVKTVPVAQMLIYGPPKYGGYCNSSHTLNSSYWSNISGDNLDWYPYYGSTPTSYTGPSGNAPGGYGLYIYLEATGGCYNKKGIVESDYWFKIPTGSTNYSLKYYYHMYGSNMGSLKVKIQKYPDGDWLERGSTKSGNKGNYWANETISLSEFEGEYIKIRFEGNTGWGERSDMALQNISIITSAKKSAVVESNSVLEEPDEQSNPVFEIFPNPASNNLNINVRELVDYNLSIYNTSGQFVFQKELKSSHVVDVGGFPEGLYFVQIKYNDPEQKVFVQNVVIN